MVVKNILVSGLLAAAGLAFGAVQAAVAASPYSVITVYEDGSVSHSEEIDETTSGTEGLLYGYQNYRVLPVQFSDPALVQKCGLTGYDYQMFPLKKMVEGGMKASTYDASETVKLEDQILYVTPKVLLTQVANYCVFDVSLDVMNKYQTKLPDMDIDKVIPVTFWEKSYLLYSLPRPSKKVMIDAFTTLGAELTIDWQKQNHLVGK